VANERLATALTFDEVLVGLPEVGWYNPVTDAELAGRLTPLVGYGLLDRSQNHGSHYSLAEEYERKSLQYSLTRKGDSTTARRSPALAVVGSYVATHNTGPGGRPAEICRTDRSSRSSRTASPACTRP
jgi:hypothetical protein